MRIKTTVVYFLWLVVVCLSSDEHRPRRKTEQDGRNKRNLQYSVSHHYSSIPQTYRLERRISTGPHHQLPPSYQNSPFLFPSGPVLRSPSQYHHSSTKGSRPLFPSIPPYAVQMEPLVHYSQRDPLYETNLLSSLNVDGHGEDLLTDNNHLNENIYGPPQHFYQHQQHQPIEPHTRIIEKPVYIKEPEPIIEIIIKESNVSLPAPPPHPLPPPKKKEEVKVFYVKYKKNPNGHGKDSVIYDKPIPAISPPIHDEIEPTQEVESYHHHHEEVVSALPPPSTTLRTIIKPDSESYHSPDNSGIKVTFGKEGFDYSKRSNKPEDLKASSALKPQSHFQPNDNHQQYQQPQARQLSFPPHTPRSRPPPPPPSFNFNSGPPPSRSPQAYRPFNQPPPQFVRSNSPPQSPQFLNSRPSFAQYSTLPRSVLQQQPPKTVGQFPVRPAPPQFHQQQQEQQQPRQPVPYQPFENLRSQQSLPHPQTHNAFRHQTHFPVNQQPPLSQPPIVFNPYNQQNRENQHQQNRGFRERPHQPQPVEQFRPQHQDFRHNHQQLPKPDSHQQFHNNQQFSLQQHQQQPAQNHHHHQQQQQQQQQQHQQHLQQQNLIPPGGELIPALPKFEQHISVLEPANQHQSQGSTEAQFNQRQQQIPQPQQTQNPHQSSQEEYNKNIQQQFQQANALQESIRQPLHQQQQHQQQQEFLNGQTVYHTTARPSVSSTRRTTEATTSTTTKEPEKPSTTTKDPTLLNAQLPDEVPDDLRAQLLSSGILNNADISVLDYDKVGDIPLSALPPDQLANFYSAGGAQQIGGAGSEPIPSYVNTDGSSLSNDDLNSEDGFGEETAASEIQEVRAEPQVEMKVVRFDPETERGQQVRDSYVKKDAAQVDPVVLNDATYNRYLPLKVSGAQFPIPDVPELKGKKISSVVVLAPVTYDFSSPRKTRQVKEITADDADLIQSDSLKKLLKNPSKENYKEFLEGQNKTKSDKQAVILLVADPPADGSEREIFMYDVATQSVSKLSGELSSAFVDAAEANVSNDANQEKSGEVQKNA